MGEIWAKPWPTARRNEKDKRVRSLFEERNPTIPKSAFIEWHWRGVVNSPDMSHTHTLAHWKPAIKTGRHIELVINRRTWFSKIEWM